MTVKDRLGMLQSKSKSELKVIVVHMLELMAETCTYITTETSRGTLGEFSSSNYARSSRLQYIHQATCYRPRTRRRSSIFAECLTSV